MIFYFSGTGNSRGIAEMTAQRLGGQAVDIVGKNPEEFGCEEEEYLGFVFPVYAWAAPEVMLEFAKKVNPGSAYTFAIATFSNVAGMALQQFSEFLPLKSGFGITMPDNYPVTDHILETPESAVDKLKAAKIRLEEVFCRIENKEEVFDVKMGEDAKDNTYVKSLIFNGEMRKTEPYHVTDACTGCGLCVKKCPADAIEMLEGKPVWRKENCYLCMACLNYCPTEAIDYGPYSQGRWRYHFQGFLPEKYVERKGKEK